MAFNINAQIVLSAPKNTASLGKQISKQLQKSTKVNINLGNTGSLKNISTQLTNINKSLTRLNSSLASTRGSIAALNSSFSKSAGGVNQLASAQSKLGSQVTKTNSSLKAQSTLLGGLAGRLGSVAKQAVAFGLISRPIYDLQRAFIQSTKDAVAFEREIVKISQVTGQSVNSLSSLRKEINALSTGLGVGAIELAETARIISQTGRSARETEVILKSLARSTLAPTFGRITDTTEGLIAALGQFNLEAKDSEAILGSLNRISKKFAVESEDLISAIRRTGGVFAQAAGQSKDTIGALQELSAIFTAVRSTTRESADTIAAGLRTIFSRIQRRGTIDFLKQFGVELTNAKGEFIGIFPAFDQLSQKLSVLIKQGDALTLSAIAEELGGIRQIGKLLPAIAQFDKARKALQEAQKGALEGLGTDVAKGLDTIDNRVKRVKESFGELIRSVFEGDSFQKFAKSILGATEGILKFGTKVAETLEPLIPLLISLGSIKLGGAIGGAIGGLKGGIGSVASGVTGQAGVQATNQNTQATNQTNSILNNTNSILTRVNTQFANLISLITADNNRSNTQIANFISVVTAGFNSVGTQLSTLNSTLATKPSTVPVAGVGGGRRRYGGGRIYGFNNGGVVPGQGNTDTVPANLTPGEFVIRKSSVKKIGVDQLQQLNAGGIVTGDRSTYGNVTPRALTSLAKRNTPNWRDLTPEQRQARTAEIAQQKNLTVVKAGEKGKQDTQKKPTKKDKKGQKITGATVGGASFGASFLEGSPKTIQSTFSQFFGKANKSGQTVFGNKLIAEASKRFPNQRITTLNAAKKKVEPRSSIQAVGTVGISTINKNAKNIFDKQIIEQVPKLFTNAVRELGVTKELDPLKGQPLSLNNLVSNSAVESIKGQFFEAFFRRVQGNVLKNEKGPDTKFDFLGPAASPETIQKLFTPSSGFEIPNEFKNNANPNNLASILGKAVTLSGSRVTFKNKGGGISGQDTVPALLTPGEFVFNKKAASRIGYGNLNRMNKQGVTGFNKGGTVGVQRFQFGGGPKPSTGIVDARGPNVDSILREEKARQKNTEATKQDTKQKKKNTAGGAKLGSAFGNLAGAGLSLSFGIGSIQQALEDGQVTFTELTNILFLVGPALGTLVVGLKEAAAEAKKFLKGASFGQKAKVGAGGVAGIVGAGLLASGAGGDTGKAVGTGLVAFSSALLLLPAPLAAVVGLVAAVGSAFDSYLKSQDKFPETVEQSKKAIDSLSKEIDKLDTQQLRERIRYLQQAGRDINLTGATESDVSGSLSGLAGYWIDAWNKGVLQGVDSGQDLDVAVQFDASAVAKRSAAIAEIVDAELALTQKSINRSYAELSEEQRQAFGAYITELQDVSTDLDNLADKRQVNRVKQNFENLKKVYEAGGQTAKDATNDFGQALEGNLQGVAKEIQKNQKKLQQAGVGPDQTGKAFSELAKAAESGDIDQVIAQTRQLQELLARAGIGINEFNVAGAVLGQTFGDLSTGLDAGLSIALQETQRQVEKFTSVLDTLNNTLSNAFDKITNNFDRTTKDIDNILSGSSQFNAGRADNPFAQGTTSDERQAGIDAIGRASGQDVSQIKQLDFAFSNLEDFANRFVEATDPDQFKVAGDFVDAFEAEFGPLPEKVSSAITQSIESGQLNREGTPAANLLESLKQQLDQADFAGAITQGTIEPFREGLQAAFDTGINQQLELLEKAVNRQLKITEAINKRNLDNVRIEEQTAKLRSQVFGIERNAFQVAQENAQNRLRAVGATPGTDPRTLANQRTAIEARRAQLRTEVGSGFKTAKEAQPELDKLTSQLETNTQALNILSDRTEELGAIQTQIADEQRKRANAEKGIEEIIQTALSGDQSAIQELNNRLGSVARLVQGTSFSPRDAAEGLKELRGPILELFKNSFGEKTVQDFLSNTQAGLGEIVASNFGGPIGFFAGVGSQQIRETQFNESQLQGAFDTIAQEQRIARQAQQAGQDDLLRQAQSGDAATSKAFSDATAAFGTYVENFNKAIEDLGGGGGTAGEFRTGGLVYRAGGGTVTGSAGAGAAAAKLGSQLGVNFAPKGTDTVPAMLSPGEFVIQRSAVQRIGIGNLQALNDGRASGFQVGGVVYHDRGGLNQARDAGRVKIGTVAGQDLEAQRYELPPLQRYINAYTAKNPGTDPQDFIREYTNDKKFQAVVNKVIAQALQLEDEQAAKGNKEFIAPALRGADKFSTGTASDQNPEILQEVARDSSKQEGRKYEPQPQQSPPPPKAPPKPTEPPKPETTGATEEEVKKVAKPKGRSPQEIQLMNEFNGYVLKGIANARAGRNPKALGRGWTKAKDILGSRIRLLLQNGYITNEDRDRIVNEVNAATARLGIPYNFTSTVPSSNASGEIIGNDIVGASRRSKAAGKRFDKITGSQRTGAGRSKNSISVRELDLRNRDEQLKNFATSGVTGKAAGGVIYRATGGCVGGDCGKGKSPVYRAHGGELHGLSAGPWDFAVKGVGALRANYVPPVFDTYPDFEGKTSNYSDDPFLNSYSDKFRNGLPTPEYAKYYKEKYKQWMNSDGGGKAYVKQFKKEPRTDFDLNGQVAPPLATSNKEQAGTPTPAGAPPATPTADDVRSRAATGLDPATGAGGTPTTPTQPQNQQPTGGTFLELGGTGARGATQTGASARALGTFGSTTGVGSLGGLTSNTENFLGRGFTTPTSPQQAQAAQETVPQEEKFVKSAPESKELEKAAEPAGCGPYPWQESFNSLVMKGIYRAKFKGKNPKAFGSGWGRARDVLEQGMRGESRDCIKKVKQQILDAQQRLGISKSYYDFGGVLYEGLSDGTGTGTRGALSSFDSNKKSARRLDDLTGMGGGTQSVRKINAAKGFNTGGEVPAMLTPGEFVMNADAVRRNGVNFMENLNNGQIPRYHTGGLVYKQGGGGVTQGGGNNGGSMSLDPTELVNGLMEALQKGGEKLSEQLNSALGQANDRLDQSSSKLAAFPEKTSVEIAPVQVVGTDSIGNAIAEQLYSKLAPLLQKQYGADNSPPASQGGGVQSPS